MSVRPNALLLVQKKMYRNICLPRPKEIFCNTERMGYICIDSAWAFYMLTPEGIPQGLIMTPLLISPDFYSVCIGSVT